MERDKDFYMKVVKEIMKCKIKFYREEIEKKNGIRYLVFLEFDYFDFIVMIIIDLMYNLFLGIVKRMLIVWKD